MAGGRKTLRPGAPIGLRRADHLSCRIGLDVQAMFDHRFNSHSAGDFAVRLAPHAVGKHEEAQRLNDLVAIFVVCTHATHIGHAATCDSHTHSRCRRETTPLPPPVPGNSPPTLAEPQGSRKALNPTDYSLFRHMTAGNDASSSVCGLFPDCSGVAFTRRSSPLQFRACPCASAVLEFPSFLSLPVYSRLGLMVSRLGQRLPGRGHCCCRGESFRANGPRLPCWTRTDA